MTQTQDIEAIREFYDFFLSKNAAPSSSGIAADDLARILKSPMFDRHVFGNSFLAIIDESKMKYVYVSPAAKDYIGYDAEELMKHGPGIVLKLIEPEDLNHLVSIFTRVYEVVSALPLRQRLYFHFYYTFRLKAPRGTACFHQQTIPLALNDKGEPYMVLVLVSNVTEFKRDTAVHFNCVLKEPGQPIRTLISGNSSQAESVLTKREKAIVQCLADGKDSQDVADQLFISHGTVRTHRKNILQKTGAKNVAHLVQLALANGWI